MGDNDFKTELFTRMNRLEQGQAAMLAMLKERCASRGDTLAKIEAQTAVLIAEKHKQAGEKKVMAGILTVLGTIGGAVAGLTVKIIGGQ